MSFPLSLLHETDIMSFFNTGLTLLWFYSNYVKSSLHKKWSFPLRISTVNVTKSAVLLRIWSHLLKKSLMILTWKNLSLTEKKSLKYKLAASDVFHIFTNQWKNSFKSKSQGKATLKTFSKNLEKYVLRTCNFTKNERFISYFSRILLKSFRGFLSQNTSLYIGNSKLCTAFLR